MTPFLFVVASLAIYRIADVLSEEAGPFAIFSRLRRKVPARSNAGQGIRCPFCVGVWVSALATAFLWWLGLIPAPLAPIYLFGLSGAAAAWKRIAD